MLVRGTEAGVLRVCILLQFRVQNLLGLLREMRRLHLAVLSHLAELNIMGDCAVGLLLLHVVERGLVHIDNVAGDFCTGS